MTNDTFIMARQRMAAAGLILMLLAVCFPLVPAAPARASSIGFIKLPIAAVPGIPFKFSVMASLAPQESFAIQSAALRIGKVGGFPPREAVCANLPLSSGSKAYANADTGGGKVSIVATSADNWTFASGWLGPGPASLVYDVTWTMPAWPAGPGQVEISLIGRDTSVTQTASFFIAASAPSGTIMASPYTNALGIFLQTLNAASYDGRATLTIKQGAKGLISREPLMQMNIVAMTVPPTAPTDTIIIDAYAFDPEAATFDPSANISITYRTTELPDGLDPTKLVMAVWNTSTGKWNTLASSVGISSHVVSTAATQFGTFGILAQTRPAAFTVGNLSISPSVVDIGKPVSVGVTVTNTGDLSGTYNVSLKVNNMAVASTDVMVAGGASQKVTLAAVGSAAATYAVDVNGCTGSFTARPPTSPSATASRPTPSSTPRPTPATTPTTSPTPAPTPAPTPPAKPTAPEPPSIRWPGWLPYVGIVILGVGFWLLIRKTSTSR